MAVIFAVCSVVSGPVQPKRVLLERPAVIEGKDVERLVVSDVHDDEPPGLEIGLWYPVKRQDRATSLSLESGFVRN
jgi:hypothetical protein